MSAANREGSERVFKIVFQSQGRVVELYARQIGQSSLFGFIEIEDLLFGARSELVVDPTEEGLRAEFGGARRLYLPLHAIVRIEEVERQGVPRSEALPAGAQIMPFPVAVATPREPRS